MSDALSPLATGRRVLDLEAKAVAELSRRLDQSFNDAVHHLVECKGRVILTGMGKSGIICQKIAATLSSTGLPAYFMHPAEAAHGDLGMLVAGDVLLAVSNSGETAEILRLLELVRRLDARIVSMTGAPDSTLAHHSDVHLDVSVAREACNLDLVPTASTTAALAMGDALAVACFESQGFSKQDFARFHPGGRLGRKLQLVQDLMHRGTEVPIVKSGDTLGHAVETLSAARLGMTCVVDEDDRLCGVITDGDLRRRMIASPRPMEGTAGMAMTRDPTTISAGALATEALQLMEQRRITSLPVVADDGVVSGVIQIHDLWRTELF